MSLANHVAAVVAASSFVLAGTAAARSEPPSAEGDDRRIVVTGQVQPPPHDRVTRQARNISIIGDPLHSPLPRFEDHLCPGVLGLKTEAAEIVVQRIRFTAEDLGIRLAKDDGTCRPNLIVAFVEGAQEQLHTVARNNGYMLAGLSVTARGELLDVSGAARVWTNTVTRTRDGMPVPSARDAASSPERRGTSLGGSGQGDSAGQAGVRLPPVAAMQAAHSRIYFPTREDIVSVLVLLERDQVRDKTLLQLADYATMRGLATTRETNGETPAETILSLFDGAGPKPERMTQFDRAYLQVLYKGMANIPATSKLAGVHREMTRAARKSRE